MLMFYLLGINASDLFALTVEDVDDGYLTYRRKKTGKLYTIYIEKEARILLNKYKGKNYLLSWAEEGRQANWFMHEMTKCFEKLFGKHITSNSARHTWATIAASIGIPKDTITAALGHANGSKTTEIYIKRDEQARIDDANRKVLDHLFGSEDKKQ
jgi:integrase